MPGADRCSSSDCDQRAACIWQPLNCDLGVHGDDEVGAGCVARDINSHEASTPIDHGCCRGRPTMIRYGVNLPANSAGRLTRYRIMNLASPGRREMRGKHRDHGRHPKHVIVGHDEWHMLAAVPCERPRLADVLAAEDRLLALLVGVPGRRSSAPERRSPRTRAAPPSAPSAAAPPLQRAAHRRRR